MSTQVQKSPDQLLIEKWDKVLNHPDIEPIRGFRKTAAVARCLENMMTESTLNSQSLNEANAIGSYPTDGTGVAKFDPVLMALIRRAEPQLISYDVCGVQPMKLPTGLIFAMRSKYGAQNSGVEAFYNEADTDFSGTGTHAGSNPTSGTDTTGTGMSTTSMEAFSSVNEMSLTIERAAIEAKGRQLQAGYTRQLAQDLKRLHGLDADTELANMLSEEIVLEQNREIIRTMYYVAKPGAQINVTTPGTFNLDTDANGRWSEERFKGMLFAIERDRNAIFQQTRRGRGNFIICSADVASALAMTGKLSYAPDVAGSNKVNDGAMENTTYVGTINGMKVYVDPYSAAVSANQFVLIGYKGKSEWDAGMFYCPYIPLERYDAVDPANFQPKLAFMTRYALVNHPFAEGTTAAVGALNAGTNVYFRLIKVTNLM